MEHEAASDMAEVAKERLGYIEEVSKNAGKLFLAVLGGCAYCWLTIAATSDVALIAGGSAAKLPIIETEIEVGLSRFYFVAPLLLLGLYLYFHHYLQDLWEEVERLAKVAETLPGDLPLYKRIYPWILGDFVRLHPPPDTPRRMPRSLRRTWAMFIDLPLGAAVLFAWGAIPFTLLYFWLRYLAAHDAVVTGFHILFFGFSGIAAVVSYSRAVDTLEPKTYHWRKLNVFWIVLLVGACLWASRHVMRCVPREEVQSLTEKQELDVGMPWIAAFLRRVNAYPVAHFSEAQVSTKPAGWNGKSREDLFQVTGALLRGRDLRYASAFQAFLVGADLRGANLRAADLEQADLRGAKMRNAELNHAFLCEAHLEWADLQEAGIESARLERAHLYRAQLRGARLLGSNLQNADLRGADLSMARLAPRSIGNTLVPTDLRKARLDYARLEAANLQKANLEEANLPSAYLPNANLQYASLKWAYLLRANLFTADLQYTDLEYARLVGASLRGAKLQYTRLVRADLSEANLEEADLSRANLQAAKLEKTRFQAANLSGTDLRGVDLTLAVGLTQKQIDKAITDGTTGLPSGLRARAASAGARRASRG